MEALVADPLLVDLTRVRQSGTTVNADRLTRACELIAARVTSRLGPIALPDDAAVDIGARLVALDLRNFWPMSFTAEGQAALEGVLDDLEFERRRRVGAALRPVALRTPNETLEVALPAAYRDDDEA